MATTQSLSMVVGIPAIFVFLATFTLIIRSSDAIKCYECNSKYDPACADPFRNATFERTDCDMRSLEQFKGQKATVCRKIIQKVRDDYRFVRSCGFLKSDKEATECIKRAGTFNVLVQYCSCDTDDCNAAFSFLRSANGFLSNLIFPAVTTVLASIAVK